MDNGSSKDAVITAGQANPRQAIAEQLSSSSSSDGSLYAQLSGNPFFTAVRLILFETSIKVRSHAQLRASVSPCWALV